MGSTFMKEKIHELMVSCNSTGLVTKILSAEESFSEFFQVGELFLKNVDAGSVAKALSFFTELKASKIITNQEINFSYNGEVVTLVLSGAHDQDELILLVTSRQIDFLAFEEVMAINSEQVNLFRKAVKEKAEQNSPKENTEYKYFDEISRLNNELMNVQRELAKKNNELLQVNQKLEELTMKDSLTDLFNVRYLYIKFQEEIAHSHRYQYPVALAMIDLNNFKQINDQQGHLEGDRVLMKFAELSKKNTRDQLDYVFRVGGDEFLLLLTHCEEEMAHVILERLAEEYQKVNSLSTMAYGISSFIGKPEQHLDELLKVVDAKMYAHKHKMKQEQQTNDGSAKSR